MQRILDGSDVREHDRLLFRHENLEASYMAQGMGQQEAHNRANLSYNYAQALSDYKKKGGAV